MAEKIAGKIVDGQEVTTAPWTCECASCATGSIWLIETDADQSSFTRQTMYWSGTDDHGNRWDYRPAGAHHFAHASDAEYFEAQAVMMDTSKLGKLRVIQFNIR